MLDYILNLIYPNVCGICGKIHKESLCKKCELKLQKYEINNNVGAGFHARPIQLISIFKYESEIRDQIIKYKFGEKAYLYKTFARMILNNKKVCKILGQYDIILPVPIHKNKRRKRGYNQTELIAKEISKNSPNLHIGRNILIKIKDTKTQSLLTRTQRRENVKNAFIINKEENVRNKKVILFDDIYTTGATTNECIRILKKYGTKEILILTVAKD